MKKETEEETTIPEDNKQQLLIDNGIFSEYYDKSYNLLKNMTLDEKIAQILLVRVPKDNEYDALKEYQFGGYLLFAKDTLNITKENFINKTSEYQRVSKIPIIIAVDEEGGTVSRIGINPNLSETKFKSPMELYKEGGLDLIDYDNKNKNKILEELGINLNLAPVVDIASEGSFIYNRTIGADIEILKEYVKRTINISKESKVSNTLKHFPGYGDNVDTHTGIAYDNRTLEEFKNKDFIPFKVGIDSGAESILVNHNIISNIEEVPASLSLKIHNILREDLNFTGIIITDDLYMDAIKQYQEKPAVSALKAGNDFIIIKDYISGINEIKEAINNNELNIEILDKAVLRILSWKYYKGLLK